MQDPKTKKLRIYVSTLRLVLSDVEASPLRSEALGADQCALVRCSRGLRPRNLRSSTDETSGLPWYLYSH